MGRQQRPDDERPAEPRRRRLLERLLFSVMGPPQVGDVHAPSTYVPDPAATRCRRCGRPWDEHEVVRTGSMTYARCPTAPADGLA